MDKSLEKKKTAIKTKLISKSQGLIETPKAENLALSKTEKPAKSVVNSKASSIKKLPSRSTIEFSPNEWNVNNPSSNNKGQATPGPHAKEIMKTRTAYKPVQR